MWLPWKQSQTVCCKISEFIMLYKYNYTCLIFIYIVSSKFMLQYHEILYKEENYSTVHTFDIPRV